MTARAAPKTSGEQRAAKPRNGTGLQTEDAIVEDADNNGGSDRDLVRGEGGTVEIPDSPRDLSKDD